MLKLLPQHFKVYEANVKKSESIGVENDFSFLFFQLFSFFNLFILFFQKKKNLFILSNNLIDSKFNIQRLSSKQSFMNKT